ncbi:NAD(P)-binding protein [Auriculariales sp. MPI-PUGE-AT-0066]|nr:NAD(P)-binding protein [Auriculariales sp. MPI-PUGE-AT-0066]
MSVSQNVAIIGGAGQVALLLTKILASKGRKVISVIRKPEQASTIEAVGGKPVVLSLEESPVDAFAALFGGVNVVVFCAGASGHRTKAVDHDGAVKVYDAIELTANKPRLIVLSAIGDEEDKKGEDHAYAVIGEYMKWKYEADKKLVQRTAFKWTILRPTWLDDEPATGTGHARIGRTHMTPNVTRYDVADTLALLVDRPDAAGLALDLVGVVDGERSPLNTIPVALDTAIRKGETDFEM